MEMVSSSSLTIYIVQFLESIFFLFYTHVMDIMYYRSVKEVDRFQYLEIGIMQMRCQLHSISSVQDKQGWSAIAAIHHLKKIILTFMLFISTNLTFMLSLMLLKERSVFLIFAILESWRCAYLYLHLFIYINKWTNLKYDDSCASFFYSINFILHKAMEEDYKYGKLNPTNKVKFK